MKKLLLFAVGSLMAFPSLAQDEDMTYLITNATFDEDLTWQADGSMKPAVETKRLSDRTIAAIAADGSLYATVNPTTPKNRPDGRKLEATNGFVGMIKGWDWVNLKNDALPNERIESKACEWVYFGVVSYDLGATTVPIADDGKDYLTVPAKPTDFDGGAGALYLRAGWGNSFAYKQLVNLPCAKYRLEYWTINVNPNTTASATDLSKITCRKDVFSEEGGTALTAKEWTKHEFEFTPTSEFTIQFGFQAGDGGSGATPWVYIDGIKLYKIGEADPMELLESDVNDLIDECNTLSSQASLEGFEGLSAQIGDYGLELDELLSIHNQAELEAALKQATAQVESFKTAMNTMESINSLMTKIDNLLQTTDFAGKADLEAVQAELQDMKNGDLAGGTNYAELMLTAVEKGKAAIKAYYMSQVETASVDNPADLTILVKNPWFIAEDAEPIQSDGAWVFPLRYEQNAETGEDVDRYKEGSATSPDLTSEGWYIAGATGGDQRLNWQRGRSCWNAWNSGFTTTLAVAQDLTDLPNGYYGISADLITQAGYANGTQKVFAESTTGKSISEAYLTSEDWDNSAWETVAMTADEKVLVVDGKLTIGAQGTGDGTASAGWFLATNFKLFYYGAASDEVMQAALQQSFDTQFTTARELAETMHFAGDKKALNDTIAKYGTPADNEAMIASIEAVKAAITEAQNSEAKYFEYLPTQEQLDENPDLLGQKTLLWVKALLNDEYVEGHEFFSADTKPIAQFALDYVNGYLACDTATYKQFDNTVNLLKNYINTYIPAYDKAAEVADVAGEKGKAALVALMSRQKEALVSEMKDLDTVNAYVAELNNMADLVKMQNIYDDPNATDYTAFIKNPNAEAIDGWTVEKGNGDGNGAKSGQWMDDSATRYFDSYNSAGLNGFKISQVVKNIPNGTYTVGVYTRTPQEGAYIFNAVAADTTFVEIPLDYYNTFTELGEDTVVIASDQHGPIWAQAEQAVNDGTADDLQWAIYNANSGNGRGWKHQEMANIVVTNHELTIGTMCGTEASQTEKVFAGTWYSVGGWTLTLTAMGDNAGWAGPIESGIATVTVNNGAMADGIYTLSGVKTNRLQRGMNIIVTNGQVRKLMVK